MAKICPVHGVEFFKKGTMKGYAHPIGKTGKWCNASDFDDDEEVEEEPTATPATKASQMTKGDWDEKDRRTRKSIERQKSLELAVNVAIAFKKNETSAPAKVIEADSVKKVIDIAKQFEKYLAGNTLVDAAKQIGAKEGDEN